MNTSVRTDTTPNVHEMVVIHRVFRREFRALPTLVRGVREGDTAHARLVGSHLTLILDGLHMHHTGEDEVLWPLLLERDAPDAELVATMQAQHDGVDGYSAQIHALRTEWLVSASAVRGEQLARLVEDFTVALLEHLDLEERDILPLVSRYIAVDEWNSLGERGRGEMSPRQLPLMFGSILEEADDSERAMMLAPMPTVVRWFMTTIGGWQYRRYISRVRAA